VKGKRRLAFWIPMAKGWKFSLELGIGLCMMEMNISRLLLWVCVMSNKVRMDGNLASTYLLPTLSKPSVYTKFTATRLLQLQGIKSNKMPLEPRHGARDSTVEIFMWTGTFVILYPHREARRSLTTIHLHHGYEDTLSKISP